MEQFRAHYASRLRELTFNSRPLIQELSISAMTQRETGNWDNMRVIVEEIEQATVRVRSIFFRADQILLLMKPVFLGKMAENCRRFRRTPKRNYRYFT